MPKSEESPGFSVRNLLLVTGAFIALSTLRQWDSTHRIYHAVTLALFLGTVPFRKARLARTILMMLPILGIAEILMRNLFVPAFLRESLTPGWIGLAALYLVTLVLMSVYDHRLKSGEPHRA